MSGAGVAGSGWGHTEASHFRSSCGSHRDLFILGQVLGQARVLRDTLGTCALVQRV